MCEERSLSLTEPAAPALPRRPDLLSRAGLTPESGNQFKVSSLLERGRARMLILITRLPGHLEPHLQTESRGGGFHQPEKTLEPSPPLLSPNVKGLAGF